METAGCGGACLPLARPLQREEDEPDLTAMCRTQPGQGQSEGRLPFFFFSLGISARRRKEGLITSHGWPGRKKKWERVEETCFYLPCSHAWQVGTPPPSQPSLGFFGGEGRRGGLWSDLGPSKIPTQQSLLVLSLDRCRLDPKTPVSSSVASAA